MYYQREARNRENLCDLLTATQPAIKDDVAIWTQVYLASKPALPHLTKCVFALTFLLPQGFRQPQRSKVRCQISFASCHLPLLCLLLLPFTSFLKLRVDKTTYFNHNKHVIHHWKRSLYSLVALNNTLRF